MGLKGLIASTTNLQGRPIHPCHLVVMAVPVVVSIMSYRHFISWDRVSQVLGQGGRKLSLHC